MLGREWSLSCRDRSDLSAPSEDCDACIKLLPTVPVGEAGRVFILLCIITRVKPPSLPVSSFGPRLVKFNVALLKLPRGPIAPLDVDGRVFIDITVASCSNSAGIGSRARALPGDQPTVRGRTASTVQS